MNNNKFPNGFESWYETFFEITAYTLSNADIEGTIANYYQMAGGRGALYELAEELTNEFETKYQGREWDGEFFDTIDKFLNEKSYNFKPTN